MGGLNKQGEEKNRVPDTAHDCPILCIGVMHEQPVSEKRKSIEMGAFLFLPQSVPAPQNHRHLHFVSDNVGWKIWLGGCRFSGGEMTGKFRKVASHYAPEPALGCP